ncbi:MAG TPA: DUF6064 family protein [Burkholderiaceae bacterium]|nr:DUF6064 family protein [Burkholderiaceae bacterium]
MLPFTPEQFFAVFADYNAAVWPAQAVAYALGLVMAVALLRPSRGSNLMLGAGLALMWAWTGVVYHGLFFSSINGAALLFAALFMLQGLLFAHAGLLRRDLHAARARGLAGIAGWTLVIYAALLYPVLGIVSGHRYPATPMFGITPCPVTLFTLGVLLLARVPVPRRLLVIPFLWTLVGGSAAFLLGVAQDWPLLLGAVVPVYLTRGATATARAPGR